MSVQDLLHQAAALIRSGEFDAALPHLREANRLQPGSPDVLNNLGAALEQLGQVEEAVACYRQAASLAPAEAVPHFNAGDLLRRAGRLDDAVPLLRAAATLDPNLPDAWAALGAALLARGEPAAARGALRRALELRPADDASARLLGDALQVLRQFGAAAGCYEQAVRHNPDSTDAWYGLGRARLEAGQPALAAAALERCIAGAPDHAPARHDLGKALFQLGCVEKAVALLRGAAEGGPEDVRHSALENLATIVPGSPADDNRSILEARRAWGRCLPSRPPTRTLRGRAPGRFRVGYVSSFFGGAHWMKPVWALINRHDRQRFEVHLFSDTPAGQVQGGYQPHADDSFHDLSGRTNEEAAGRIAAAGIDLLVDLNAYSAPRRLGIYPLRPAPKTVGWFNWYGPSGLDCFDYLIGDDSVIPAAEEPYYTERILRVPHSYLTFEVNYPVPDVAPLPMAAAGRVTLGCLASQYKLTDQVVATWAGILRRCPGVGLLLRNAALDRPETQEHLRGRFAAHGIAAGRLVLEGRAEHAEFLRTYDRIDVALDPFPYSGGTTTMEALWQGVPVVTFDAGRWASRTSISLLRAAGLVEFVGRDVREYADLCVRLATGPDAKERLEGFRAGVRDRLRRSPVCDAAAFARAMEALYLRVLEEGDG
jgi:predicted O-linked N-acetylglucosamine transferase (SPINDLY family)